MLKRLKQIFSSRSRSSGVLKYLAIKNIKRYDGFVALGCVIKGETPHFDFICSSVFNSILNLSINYNKPIGNGIITALNIDQAKNRSIKNKKNKSNKGLESANAVVTILKNEPKKI